MTFEFEMATRIRQLEKQMRFVMGLESLAGFKQEPAEQIIETAGPTTLDIGAIADGEFLKRVGTDVVGHDVLTAGGWTEIPDGSWTYASATTITVPSGAASIYAVGDQVRLKQGGAYKYFYIIVVADTTLTVTGGSDYSVANAAITDAAFSKGGGVGHPIWFNWTPSFTAGGSMTYTSVVTEVADYCIVGRVCHIILFAYGTTGGTASNQLFATLPIPATQRTANVALGFDAASGGRREVLALIDPASLTQVSLLLPGFANWSLGVGREIKISLSYRI